MLLEQSERTLIKVFLFPVCEIKPCLVLDADLLSPTFLRLLKCSATARRFWKLSRSVLEAALHGVHFHKMVSASNDLIDSLDVEKPYPSTTTKNKEVLWGTVQHRPAPEDMYIQCQSCSVGGVWNGWMDGRYRAPECLLTDGYYNYKMDMWGVGCVFFEIISLFPLFPG